jgi:hypothetical protein
MRYLLPGAVPDKIHADSRRNRLPRDQHSPSRAVGWRIGMLVVTISTGGSRGSRRSGAGTKSGKMRR